MANFGEFCASRYGLRSVFGMRTCCLIENDLCFGISGIVRMFCLERFKVDSNWVLVVNFVLVKVHPIPFLFSSEIVRFKEEPIFFTL